MRALLLAFFMLISTVANAQEFAGINIGSGFEIDDSWIALSGNSIAKELPGDFNRVFVDVEDKGISYIFSSESIEFNLFERTVSEINSNFSEVYATVDTLPVTIAENSEPKVVELQIRNGLGKVRKAWYIEDVGYAIDLSYSQDGLTVRFEPITDELRAAMSGS